MNLNASIKEIVHVSMEIFKPTSSCLYSGTSTELCLYMMA